MRLGRRKLFGSAQSGADRPIEVARSVRLDAGVAGNRIELTVEHFQRGLLTVVVGQITADLLFGRIEENHSVDGSSDLGDLPLEIKVGIGLFDQIEGVAVRRIEQFFDRAEAGIVIFRMLGTGRQCKTREQQNNQFIQYVFHRFNYFLADDLDYMRTILHVTGHNQGDIDFLTVKIAVELKLFGTIGIPGKQILGQNVILRAAQRAGAAVVAFLTGPYVTPSKTGWKL